MVKPQVETDGKTIKEKVRDAIEIDQITLYERYLLVKVKGSSMSPLLSHDANLPVEIMPSGTHYKKGDIIVFERD